MSNGNQKEELYGDYLGEERDIPTDPVLDFINDDLLTDAANWAEGLDKQLKDTIEDIAEASGMDPYTFNSWYVSEAPYLFAYLRNYQVSGQHLGQPGLDAYEARTGDTGSREISDPLGIMQRYQLALQWLAARDSMFGNAYQRWAQDGGKPPGGGAPRLTAASFDRNQLVNEVNSLWRSYLLDTTDKAGALADAYIKARVANPNQALDFETYVLGEIRKTGRYQTLYESKPEGLTEQQYLAPYLSTAMQYVNPQRATELAATGAQWGAAPGSYVQRVGRERDVQNTPAFMRKLEDKMSAVNGVLVG